MVLEYCALGTTSLPRRFPAFSCYFIPNIVNLAYGATFYTAYQGPGPD